VECTAWNALGRRHTPAIAAQGQVESTDRDESGAMMLAAAWSPKVDYFLRVDAERDCTGGGPMNDWYEAEQRVERAQELFDQRKWQEALEELRAATAINPYNSSWFFNIGLTLDELERFDEAIEAYRQALQIEPNDLEALNHLGIDLNQVGRHNEATRVFERIEGLDASYEPCYCNRIVSYIELDNHEKAEEMFYLARLYKDQCPACYYNIGSSLHARGMYDRAVFCWERVLDLDHGHPEVHVRIAEARWNQGHLEQARQHYLLGLRQDPGDLDALLDLGDLLLEMGRFGEAGEKYRRALELAPEEPSAHYCHGRWLMDGGRVDEAQGAFEHVLRLDPTYPGANLQLARLWHPRRDMEKVRQYIRGELQLRPDDPQILMDLSNLLIDIGDCRIASSCLKHLIYLDPGHVGAWQNLAVARFLRGDYRRGIETCLQALKRDPKNLMTIHNLALAHEHLKDLNGAQRWVKRGLELSPKDTDLQRLEVRLRVLKLRERMLGALRRGWSWLAGRGGRDRTGRGYVP
jgi:tetratricopeptide (TPR) repeat protein